MEIKEAQADFKKRQEAVVEEINQVATKQQELAARMKELIEEAHRLNGEARLLERLSKDGDKKQKK